MLMYIITRTDDYNCIEILGVETEWGGDGLGVGVGSGTGNLLCLSGGNAVTRPKAEKTNKIVSNLFSSLQSRQRM